MQTPAIAAVTEAETKPSTSAPDLVAAVFPQNVPVSANKSFSDSQRWVTAAVRQWISHFCHVYMDDIAVWSRSLDEHTKNITKLLQSLLDNKLYLNPKKTKLFCSEICFLGHHISAKGVEADESKTERVTNWPKLTCAKHVRSFLGLVRYLSAFLPNLAQHTCHESTSQTPPMVGPTWSRVASY